VRVRRVCAFKWLPVRFGYYHDGRVLRERRTEIISNRLSWNTRDELVR
jgi:hypothetical protein